MFPPGLQACRRNTITKGRFQVLIGIIIFLSPVVFYFKSRDTSVRSQEKDAVILAWQAVTDWPLNVDLDEIIKSVDIKSETEESKLRNRQLLEYARIQSNATERQKRLPSVIGIGVEKCGTGWLAFIMKFHAMLKAKQFEVHFFSQSLYNKGLRYYLDKMPEITEHEMAFEKAPSYFSSPETPGRIRKDLPNAKIFLILCDPVPRALSDFVHEITRDFISNTTNYDDFVEDYLLQSNHILTASGFGDTAISNSITKWNFHDRNSHVIMRGLYYYSLLDWLKVYSLEEIHIIDGEELNRYPGAVFERDFLGIPRFILAEDFVKDPETKLYCVAPNTVWKGKVGKLPPLCLTALGRTTKGRTRSANTAHTASEKTIGKLQRFYAPYNRKLFKLLSREFKWPYAY